MTRGWDDSVVASSSRPICCGLRLDARLAALCLCFGPTFAEQQPSSSFFQCAACSVRRVACGERRRRRHALREQRRMRRAVLATGGGGGGGSGSGSGHGFVTASIKPLGWGASSGSSGSNGSEVESGSPCGVGVLRDRAPHSLDST